MTLSRNCGNNGWMSHTHKHWCTHTSPRWWWDLIGILWAKGWSHRWVWGSDRKGHLVTERRTIRTREQARLPGGQRWSGSNTKELKKKKSLDLRLILILSGLKAHILKTILYCSLNLKDNFQFTFIFLRKKKSIGSSLFSALFNQLCSLLLNFPNRQIHIFKTKSYKSWWK